MNYEQKYKEALEKLQEALAPTEDGCKISGLTRDCLENIFPELKESEDDRIRKGLINGFKECLKDCQYPKNAVKYWHNVEVDSILAWLEKQEENTKTLNIKDVIKWIDYNLDDVYDYDGNYILSTLKNKFKEDFKL